MVAGPRKVEEEKITQPLKSVIRIANKDDYRREEKNREREKEDGHLKSQKILLTWMLEGEDIFRQIRQYISPSDFTEDLLRTVAEQLFAQYDSGDVNPARIMNQFTDEEEHRQVAALFNTKIRELSTAKEQEKALRETIIRVKEYSLEEKARHLAPTDIAGLQKLMEEKRALQAPDKLHISIN